MKGMPSTVRRIEEKTNVDYQELGVLLYLFSSRRSSYRTNQT